MKALALAAAVVALAGRTSAHYIFESFDHGPVYQYIRENTDGNSPVTDLTSNDLRCNVGGENGTDTQTVTVTAGSTHSFTADIAVYHQGPVSFYMSKAPSTAAAYDGSGNWFKIKDIGPTFATPCDATWDLEQTYNFTIPKSVPNGDYLVRIQQLAIHNPYPAGIPQFYIVRLNQVHQARP